jgi:hypothetical protein
MDKSLSDTEMRRYIPNLVSYDEIENMNEQDLLRKLPLVVLYLNAKDTGHWTLVHKVPGSIEFFDSYGYKPDQEFKFIPDEFQTPKYLAKLLNKIIKTVPISYNQYQFQEKRHGVNTCGRHVIMRHMYGGVGIDKYKQGVDYVCKNFGITPDQLAVGITS